MSSGRILVVEDDIDISEMLKIYFTGHGYQVEIATRGGDALNMVSRQLPDLIVLDIMLPDLDGYTVCRQLRTTTRTSHIPIIFLTQKDERSDKITGLELGADDYVTKPFDIEELKLRVRTAIRAHQRLNMTDPRTGLPSGRLIEEQLRELMLRRDWVFILVGIDHFDLFSETYGFVAGDELLRFAGMLLSDLIDEYGTANDFLGHASSDSFIVVSFSEEPDAFVDALHRRFTKEVRPHYNFLDLERGGIALGNGTIGPLMDLSFGIVDGRSEPFADIRQITESAAERRRAYREQHVQRSQ
jgi:PleD family two-component response regulator